MGQKTNPIGIRLGITRQWDANWFDEKNVADKLSEDLMVRSYIKSSKRKAGVARIVIERTAKQLRITLHTSRPGVIIGKSGKDITLLEEELKQISKKDVKILIHEIKRPEVDAQLV
ncbi:MAG: 30S ribosomal protein S3, partial [Candidatus Kapaibacteriota bacterium]